MTKKIIWRLGEKPSTKSLQELVSCGILNKEEAREILFNYEEADERSIESFKQEIKFLRELVEKLSNRTQIVGVIKEVYKPYYNYQWYVPYYNYCGGVTGITTCDGQSGTLIVSGNSYMNTTAGGNSVDTGALTNFSSIQTF
jgi:hypothetical protein